MNADHCPPSLISGRSDRSWIDVTLATESLALSADSSFLDASLFISSDHRTIFCNLDGVPLCTKFFWRKAWNRAQWAGFVAIVAPGREEVGFVMNIESGSISYRLKIMLFSWLACFRT